MEFTGERPTIESGSDGSLLRYHSILPFCQNKIVLDYGCGIGVGTRYLKPYCKEIYGYEPCQEAVIEARKLSKGICFIDDVNYDIEKSSYTFHICCMVEVIEHIEKEDLDKILTNLKCDLVGTTPNGDLFKYHPKSLAERRGFHVLHYTYNELKDLLDRFYSFVEVYGAIWDPVLSAFTSYNFIAKNKK